MKLALLYLAAENSVDVYADVCSIYRVAVSSSLSKWINSCALNV